MENLHFEDYRITDEELNNKGVNYDYRELRLGHDVRLKDIVEELMMSLSQYTEYERGVRVYAEKDRQLEFEEDFLDAVTKLVNFNARYEVDDEGLIWNKVTDKVVEEAIPLIKYNGYNLVKASVELGVMTESLEEGLLAVGFTNFRRTTWGQI